MKSCISNCSEEASVKIGFVLDDSLDKSDGVQQYVLTIGKWLRQQGHSVHYLVGQSYRVDVPHVHSLSRNVQVHFNQNRMSTPLPASRRRIRQLLNEEDFDVLHVQLPYSPWLAGRIIKSAPARTAVIGTFHIIPFSRTERLAARLLAFWTGRTNRRFDKVVSVSGPARDFARQTFGFTTDVIPNAVSVGSFRAGRKPRRYDDDKLNLVFLGRLVARKGCMHLLEAVRLLHERRQTDRLRVLVCGKGPLEAELKDYVRRHRLGNLVRFIGYVEEAEKPDYLAAADVAVMPSKGGESFGIVLIEAMAAGSDVVIGGNNAGYRSVLSERPEQLIDPDDTEAFARTLRHFLSSHKARRAAKRWQQEHVIQFDVKEVGTRLLELYQAAIAKRRHNTDNRTK
jgi:phosphatidyl-myo-inositol alpha-mannosyltransferase